jgi:hypothetical protein
VLKHRKQKETILAKMSKTRNVGPNNTSFIEDPVKKVPGTS